MSPGRVAALRPALGALRYPGPAAGAEEVLLGSAVDLRGLLADRTLQLTLLLLDGPQQLLQLLSRGFLVFNVGCLFFLITTFPVTRDLASGSLGFSLLQTCVRIIFLFFLLALRS